MIGMLHNRDDGNNCRGFTLLEILVTIVISAILAVILVQIMSGQSQRSYLPLQIYNDRLALDSAMENITADYRELRSTESMSHLTLSTLHDRVEPATGRTSYWADSSGIQVINNYCLYLNKDDSADPGENNIRSTCWASDRILKITLGKGELSLTTLFTLQ